MHGGLEVIENFAAKHKMPISWDQDILCILKEICFVLSNTGTDEQHNIVNKGLFIIYAIIKTEGKERFC